MSDFGYLHNDAAIRREEYRRLDPPDEIEIVMCRVCDLPADECPSLECSWCGEGHDADHTGCAVKKHIFGCIGEPCDCAKRYQEYNAALTARIDEIIAAEALEDHREARS